MNLVGRDVVVPQSPAASQSSAKLHHRPDIQGLRAVAVLLVVLGHAGVSFLQGGFVGVDVFFVLSGFLITGLLLAGAEARGTVSLADFYVRRGRRILPAAALTLLATDIAAYSLLNFVRAKQVAQDSIWAALFGANIHFANIGTDYFARGQPPSPIQHYWSLAVEEQFYLVWPLLLALVLFGTTLILRARADASASFPGPSPTAMRRLGAVIVLISVASLAWSVYSTHRVPAAAFFSTLARAWELGLGAALAVFGSRLRRGAGPRAAAGWVGLAAVAAAGVAFSATTPVPGYAALLPTIGAALIIAAGIGESRSSFGVGRLLAVAPLRYVGDRSYAFYLWHWPVLIIAAQYEGHDLSLTTKLLLLAGAFLLSMISYKFFENPIRRGYPIIAGARAGLRERLVPDGFDRSRTQARPSRPPIHGLLLWPMSAFAVLVVAAVILSRIDSKEIRLSGLNPSATPGFTSAPPSTPATVLAPAPSVSATPGQTLPAVIAAVQAARRRAPIPAGLTPPVGELLNVNNPDVEYVFPGGCAPATDAQTTSRVCRLGSTASRRSIVVMGDSHAQMWLPTILKMAAQDGWVIRPIVKSGCAPYTWTSIYSPPACRAWYRWAVGQARAIHPDVTLIGGSYGAVVGASADAEQNGIADFTTAMKPFSKQVVLIADDDGIDKQPVDCLLASGANMATCTVTRTPADFRLNDDLAAVAKFDGFRFMATRGWLCYQYRCPMVVGHTIVYRDLAHLTVPYVLALFDPFRAAFRRAIGAAPR